MSRTIHLRQIIVFAIISSALVKSSFAADLATPNFEVKFLLDADQVLQARFDPRDDVREVFELKEKPRTMKMSFLDDELALNEIGWNVRFRKIEGEDGIQLTFKRRYKFEKGQLNAALKMAAQDGFDAKEKDYEAQVERGYGSFTLTFSHPKGKRAQISDADLPSTDRARQLATDFLPGKLAKANGPDWAKKHLSRARLYGPVDGKRYRGKWRDVKLDFEVWMIRSTDGDDLVPIVELSFKADEEAQAERIRSDLLLILQRHPTWLLETDSLKTQTILQRHGPKPSNH